MRSATSAPIVELGELGSSFSKSSQDDIKNFLTKTEDVYRMAYAKHEVTVPRATVFGASVNERTFLRDETGNRRFWPVNINDMMPRVENIDQLWAQNLHMWREGFSYWLDADEMATLNIAAMGNVDLTEVAEKMEEMFPQGFHTPEPNEVMLAGDYELRNTNSIAKSLEVKGPKERSQIRAYVENNGGRFGKWSVELPDGDKLRVANSVAVPVSIKAINEVGMKLRNMRVEK